MVRATAPFSIDRKGYHIVWEAIPAWVCCPEVPQIRRLVVDVLLKTE